MTRKKEEISSACKCCFDIPIMFDRYKSVDLKALTLLESDNE